MVEKARKEVENTIRQEGKMPHLKQESMDAS